MSMLTESTDGQETDIGVRFGRKDDPTDNFRTYHAPIYRADFMQASNTTQFNVQITYQIVINNESQNLKIRTNEITDYYASKKVDFDVILEEGDKVANDLLFKVIGLNKRVIELPLKLETIKNYCLSSDIKEELISDTLIWIIIRYITILKCV